MDANSINLSHCNMNSRPWHGWQLPTGLVTSLWRRRM